MINNTRLDDKRYYPFNLPHPEKKPTTLKTKVPIM